MPKLPHVQTPLAILTVTLACYACAGPESDDASTSSEDALSAGSYVVNGNALNATESRWLEFVAKEVVPHLPGTPDERLTLAARGFWWTLKEGNLERGTPGKASNPVGYNLCNTSSGDRHIGPLETCDDDPLERGQTLFGRAWQVGVAGVQVPGRRIDRVEALALQLYPGVTVDALLEQTAALAGYAPGSAVSRGVVQSRGPLRLSWLLRVPAAGFVEVVTKEVVPECIEGSKGYCYGSAWDETRKFSPSKSAAMRAIADISGILSRIPTDGGGGGGGAVNCWSPTLAKETAELACVQSASTGVWFQCKAGEWARGVNGSEGPHGTCVSIHPR